MVIGAGPAGSTVARLLATWGYSVTLLKAQQPRTPLAESLPPSIDNVFEIVGLRGEMAKAGFNRDRGNTSWWAASTPRVESYSEDRAGYHVNRRVLDDMLVDLAQRAGVVVRPASPRAIEPGADARFVVDASGRAGVLARQKGRQQDSRYRTIALCGILASERTWEVDPHHTLIEAYDRGWAWSVPLAPNRRFVSFMVDADTVQGGISQLYRRELERTVHFAQLFRASALEGAPAGRDAGLYFANAYAGDNWILVGDAGSFIEPLSSFGVKKAMVSAWTAAVVVNTCLSHPALAEAATAMFHARETETWLDHARLAAQYFDEAATRFPTPFWQKRKKAPDSISYRRGDLESALRRLRTTESVRFSLPAPVRYKERPAIVGRQIAMVQRAVLPGHPNTEYMRGMHLTTIAEMASGYSNVGDLYEGYVRQQGEAPLPDFLAALAFLIAKDILRISG